MKFSNYFCLLAFVWSIASPANAQDLGGLFKQLEDTLNSANQGQTNQSSNSSGSGATGGLGGLLNSLQQMDQSSSGSNAEPSSGAKEIATSNKTINFICKRQALKDTTFNERPYPSRVDHGWIQERINKARPRRRPVKTILLRKKRRTEWW